jgi:hypothetical protein
MSHDSTATGNHKFLDSLRSATAWCEPRFDVKRPKESLRSRELLTDSIRERLMNPLTVNAELVKAISESRLTTLRDAGVDAVNADIDDVHTKQLLIVDYSCSDMSGASEQDSQGFFNVRDIPPWETWVWHFTLPSYRHVDSGVLVTWVPPSADELAQKGVDYNPCDVLLWASPERNGNHLARRRAAIPFPTWFEALFQTR